MMCFENKLHNYPYFPRIRGYDPETKKQSNHWEDFIIAKPIKTMLIICFLDIREIVKYC